MIHTFINVSKGFLIAILILTATEQLYSYQPKDSDVIVAADGSGDYQSIQEAINHTKSFPYQRITIYIKNGVYKEKIQIYEWNSKLSLIGEDREGTVITYDDYFSKIDKGRNSTFHTPTLLVDASGTILKNLKIVNNAGAVGQAIALSITADKVKVENCSIIGNQDTVYLSGEGNKNYFKNCLIQGTTDFIFGQATAVFENCSIHSKSGSYITAASTPKGAAFGFVFIQCKLTADNGVEKVYLGRPWRYYAKTAFIQCYMDAHIRPSGWNDWNKPESHHKTLYAEYQSTGPGAAPNQRVKWSHQLSQKDAQKYTLNTILKSANDNNWYLQ